MATYSAQNYAWMVQHGYMSYADVPDELKKDVSYILNYKDDTPAKTYTAEQVANAIVALLTKEAGKTTDVKKAVASMLADAGVK